MARKAANLEATNASIRGATLHPLRVVRRELVSPSGAVVEVDVPVYPPFRLETAEERRGGSGGSPCRTSRKGRKGEHMEDERAEE